MGVSMCLMYAEIVSAVHVQDSIIDQLHELIFEYLNIHAHTVGFPELVLPILMEVRNVLVMHCLFCLFS